MVELKPKANDIKKLKSEKKKQNTLYMDDFNENSKSK